VAPLTYISRLAVAAVGSGDHTIAIAAREAFLLARVAPRALTARMALPHPCVRGVRPWRARLWHRVRPGAAVEIDLATLRVGLLGTASILEDVAKGSARRGRRA